MLFYFIYIYLFFKMDALWFYFQNTKIRIRNTIYIFRYFDNLRDMDKNKK